MEEYEFLKRLAEDVITKKELNNLDVDFVFSRIKSFLSLNEKYKKKVFEKLDTCKTYEQFRRTAEHDSIIKSMRSGLREVYGVFVLENEKKKYALLDELKKNPTLEAHNNALMLHQSTKERLPYYSLVYKSIFKITGVPESIVDLACGLNPLSYPYILEATKAAGTEASTYFACELSEKDLTFIKDYFKIMKINGNTKRTDLIKDDVSELTKDKGVCFLFKALDSLEASKKNISRSLLQNIRSGFIVVSFATKSIGGKKSIKNERRAWLEKIILRNNWAYSSFEIPNEIFYIIKK